MYTYIIDKITYIIDKEYLYTDYGGNNGSGEKREKSNRPAGECIQDLQSGDCL